MIFSCPSQFGQYSRSILKTRLSNRDLLKRAGWPCSQAESAAASSDSPVTSSGRSGTIMARKGSCAALGPAAQRLWYEGASL